MKRAVALVTAVFTLLIMNLARASNAFSWLRFGDEDTDGWGDQRDDRPPAAAAPLSRRNAGALKVTRSLSAGRDSVRLGLVDSTHAGAVFSLNRGGDLAVVTLDGVEVTPLDDPLGLPAILDYGGWHTEAMSTVDMALRHDGQPLMVLRGLRSYGLNPVLYAGEPGGALTELRGHTARITTTAFHPGARLLAAGDADGTIRLWDISTGMVLNTFTGAHSGPVTALAFSADGHRLVSAGGEGRVRLWESPSGALLASYRAGGGPVTALAFNRDRSRVAAAIGAPETGDGGGRVIIWNTASGDRYRTLVHLQPVTAVAFSPACDLLASGDAAGGLRLWDPVLDEALLETWQHDDAIAGLSFAPDGASLVTADQRGVVHIWGTPDTAS